MAVPADAEAMADAMGGGVGLVVSGNRPYACSGSDPLRIAARSSKDVACLRIKGRALSTLGPKFPFFLRTLGALVDLFVRLTGDFVDITWLTGAFGALVSLFLGLTGDFVDS